jgi:hypothetical protein
MNMPNLINCDGCGEQIEAEDALQCVGCLNYFCRNCASDIGTGVDIMHGQCKQCEKCGEGILADCEQRKQELIVAKIKAAMAILEQSPCGKMGKREPAVTRWSQRIGLHGMTADMMLAELNHGRDFDANYYTAQMAWLELNELLEAIV